MVGRQLGQGAFPRETVCLLACLVLVASIVFAVPFTVSAQGPTPTPPPNGVSTSDPLAAIARIALDTLQGQSTLNSDQLFEQSKQSVSTLMNNSDSGLFFLDFGNPNLGLNQFAALAARNLLLLTPL